MDTNTLTTEVTNMDTNTLTTEVTNMDTNIPIILEKLKQVIYERLTVYIISSTLRNSISLYKPFAHKNTYLHSCVPSFVSLWNQLPENFTTVSLFF